MHKAIFLRLADIP